MSRSTSRGFTLIELVVVIVILGILAAFAVPRFMNMEGEAHAATLKNMGGALISAATMAHAKCQAQTCGSAGTVVVDGQNVTMTNSYPNAATMDRTLAATSLQGFTATNQGANARRYRKTNLGATCWVQYNQAVNANAAPTITYGVAGAAGTTAFNRNLADACR